MTGVARRTGLGALLEDKVSAQYLRRTLFRSDRFCISSMAAPSAAVDPRSLNSSVFD